MEIDFVEYDMIKEDLCIKVIKHIYQKYKTINIHSRDINAKIF